MASPLPDKIIGDMVPDKIDKDEIERVAMLIHDAMDVAEPPAPFEHSRLLPNLSGWVDTQTETLAEALLKAGWTPPAPNPNTVLLDEVPIPETEALGG